MKPEEIRSIVIKQYENTTHPFLTYEKMTRWYDMAVKDDPNAIICSFCGKPNDCWDDVGWYYFPTAGCTKCWMDGNRGKIWRKKYGVGER